MFTDVMSQFNNKPPAIVAVTESQWREALEHVNYTTSIDAAVKATSIPFYEFAVVPTRWKP